MSKLTLVAAVAALSAAILAPGLAEARVITGITATTPVRCPTRSAICTITARVSPPVPSRFYDGPSTNHCYQSAAAYVGQDRRRHPCY